MPDASAPRRERALKIASRSARSMEEPITDLLEYTKTRLGRGVEIKAIEANFSSFCSDAVEQAREGHLHALFHLDVVPDCIFAFDAARMGQVISDLLSNAVQHGDRRTPIAVVLESLRDGYRLNVFNAGVPIPPGALQVIFNPLVQVPIGPAELHERPATSMGLGLFIAREIVGAHGETLDATSTAADGTTFSVWLPRQAALRIH